MGCGSSSQVVPSAENSANGHKMSNGTDMGNGHNDDDDRDDLSTVILPDSPVKKKPPIAFEIPIEDLDPSKKNIPSTPPPHLQRLLQPPQAEISLPDIEEKLAEAEMRRQMILQQRAASAQKRTQKMMKSFQDMEKVESSDHETSTDRSVMEPEQLKRPSTQTLMAAPEPPVVCEAKNI